MEQDNVLTREELYAYYRGTFEKKNKSGMKHTKDTWNRKAAELGKQLEENSVMAYVTGERVRNCIEILKRRGIFPDKPYENTDHDVLSGRKPFNCGNMAKPDTAKPDTAKPDCSANTSVIRNQDGFTLLDIGCGPGRFAAGFAPYVKLACGTDISDEMCRASKQYCDERGLENTLFFTENFRENNEWDEELKGAFDLCFSFMTPAVSHYDEIQKMMRFSRKWCMSGFCLGTGSRFDDAVFAGLDRSRVRKRIDDNWFYSLFNLLWLEGYLPETDCYTIKYKEEIPLSEERILHQLKKLIHPEDLAEADIGKVISTVYEKSDCGIFHENCEMLFGTILWDVTAKRPAEN